MKRKKFYIGPATKINNGRSNFSGFFFDVHHSDKCRISEGCQCGEGRQLIIRLNFPENCMEINKAWAEKFATAPHNQIAYKKAKWSKSWSVQDLVVLHKLSTLMAYFRYMPGNCLSANVPIKLTVNYINLKYTTNK